MYLFIPLITMAIISREKGTGTIKLLYSSPEAMRRSYFGKYLALVLFIFTASALHFHLWPLRHDQYCKCRQRPYFLWAAGTVSARLCMLRWGYSVSSITVYPIVAAISTMCLLAFLHFADHWGQGTKFVVRDITYWLSMKGRVNTFIRGMITTEDVIYFLP